MKNLFNDISQEERKRILEMHENATKRNYLSEQTAPSNLTVPKTVTSKIPPKFNWANMSNLWPRQSQGYTPGDDYFWLAKKAEGSGNSELLLCTFLPSGSISPKYRVSFVGNSTWETDGALQANFTEDSKIDPSLILTSLFVYNPVATQWNGSEIQPEIYSQFLIDYLRKNPNSQIARALTVPPRVVGNDVTAENVKTIINSPLYKQLAKPATPATPATPQGVTPQK